MELTESLGVAEKPQ